MKHYVLGNGRVATPQEQEALTKQSYNDKNRIDLILAANNLAHWLDQSPSKICHQSIAADKGWWRYWTGTHWAIYDEVVLYRDLDWLFSGELLARSLKELVATLRAKLGVSHSQFDRKPIVVLQNVVLQVVDNRIQKYEPGFQPSDYVTLQVPIKLTKQPTPVWDSILAKVLPNEQDRMTWQEMLGACFFPSLQLQTFFALLGDAGTGKSTFLAILADMLGSGVTSVPLARLSESHATAGLVGSLVNIDSEAEFLDVRGEATLKAISGCDPILINQKYLPAYTTVLPCKIIIATNELPRFADKSQGLWSRMVQLPFTTPIPAGERKTVGEIVASVRPEHGAILAWALEGLQRVPRKGTRATAFTQSTLAKQQVADHKRFSSPFEEWFEEQLELVSDAAVPKQYAYQRYREWCFECGYKPLASNGFGRLMFQAKGVGTGREHGKSRTYTGISIRQNADECGT